MSKHRKMQPATKVAPAAQTGKRWTTADSYANFEARVGVAANNQSSSGEYRFDFLSRNRVQLEAMYRSSWIVGQAVDVIAEDMTRGGVDIGGTIKPDQMDKLAGAMRRLRVWDRICDLVKWARLYGGAIGVLLIDGQKMDTPLRLDSIGTGAFKGLMILDRWLVQPTLNQLVQDFGPDFGMPMYYDVVADSMALKRQRIHYSRIVRVDGVDLPYWQKISENLWGQSVVERLFDRLLAFDSTTQGIAQLVYKAHLRTYKVQGLREVIAMGGPAMDGLVKQMEFIRRYQSNEGLTLMDSADEFETHQYTFTGLDDVLLQFGQQISGALQIPMVRLFGQSPAGMNATGESDLKMYYEKVNQEQERRLRSPMSLILDVMCRSELGMEPDESFGFDFNPLSQMTETEKADIAQKITQTVTEAMDVGLISEQVALRELRQSSEETGVWTNITDEMIEAADDKPPEIGAVEEPNAFRPDAGQSEQKAAEEKAAPAEADA